MNPEVLIFSDLHLNWKACKVIFEEVKKRNITNVFNLGDEDAFIGKTDEAYRALFEPLINFNNNGYELTCLIGNRSGGIPKELFTNYVGVNDEGRVVGKWIYKQENIIAGHDGEQIAKAYKDVIENYDDSNPLVIFHGHSHSMGVLPEYKWLNDNEKIRIIEEGERTFKLESGKVYWVNPGAQEYMMNGTQHAANFAIYSPEKQKVTLHSVPYERVAR